jgi:hypothetical protein
LFDSLLFERDRCEQLIKRLKGTKELVNKLLEYLVTCLAEINHAFAIAYAQEKENMEKKHQEQIQKIEENHQMQQNQTRTAEPAIHLEYQIIEQKLQYTKWPEWTRDEQICNSIGTDEDSVMSGKFVIPGYCCLKLKPK